MWLSLRLFSVHEFEALVELFPLSVSRFSLTAFSRAVGMAAILSLKKLLGSASISPSIFASSCCASLTKSTTLLVPFLIYSESFFSMLSLTDLKGSRRVTCIRLAIFPCLQGFQSYDDVHVTNVYRF